MRDTAAAFPGEAIFEEHQALRAALDELDLKLADAAVDGCKDGQGAALVRALEALARRLGEHFEREEATGYLPEAYALSPGHAAEADILLAEHRDILVHATDLIRALQGAVSGREAWIRMLELYRDFAGHLRDHEQAESSLVRRALSEDPGVRER